MSFYAGKVGKKKASTDFIQSNIIFFLFHEENIKRRFCDLLVSINMTKSKIKQT